MAEKDPKLKVLIVGAGLSGLCAANLLVESGVNVDVYEALDRVGGRTYSIKGVDMGGAFVGPDKKRTIYLADKLGVKQIQLDKDGLYTFFIDGKIYRSKLAIPFGAIGFQDLLALLWGMLNVMWKTHQIDLIEPWKSEDASKWDKMTVQDYFVSLLFTDVTAELFRMIVVILVGVEPSEMSLLYFLWYLKSGHGIIDILTGAQSAVFKDGSQQMCEKLAEGLVTSDNKVITNSPTLTISKTDNNKVTFTQETGETVQGDYAIVSTTPAVRNQIKFNNLNYSALYMQYAQRMPMGSILKTFMYYDTKWWNTNGFNGIATITGEDNYVGQIFDISQQTPQPCLMGFVLGDMARKWQTLTDEEKSTAVQKEYTNLFADGKPAPNFTQFSEYDWMKVSYIGGTGGIAGPGTTTSFHQAISTPIDNKIFFAGTETASEWSGYMDGAIQSGWTAAKEIMKRENIPFKDPENNIKKDKNFLQEIEGLCFEILKEATSAFEREEKKVVKILPELESLEKVFAKLCELGFSESNKELSKFISENLKCVQVLVQEFEGKGIPLHPSKIEHDIKKIMGTKLRHLETMATHEVKEIVHYIGSHLTFENSTPREEKTQEADAMQIEEKLKHIKRHSEVYYPENTDQVVDLVHYSRKEGKVARCRGAGHSVKASIFESEGIDMVLSGDLRAVTLVEKLPEGKAVFKVGGGCYIGVNPMDPHSTRENSLSYQISELGYGISIVGGISHQSMAGFMLTGSSGGSVKYGFPETIREIQFVNGKGEIKTVSQTVDSDLLYAVGVSMGLFGIVISVTFEVDPYFNVEGEENNVYEDESTLQPKVFLNNLKTEEYFHVQWLPQKGVGRVNQFRAHKTQSTHIKKYHHALGNMVTAIEAAIALKIIDEILKNNTTIDQCKEKFIACILNLFLPVPSCEMFCDKWYLILPNDDHAPVDTIMKVNFLEMWFPIEFANDLIKILKEKVFTDPKKCGSIATEIYASKRSPFWLSMSYGRDVVRVDKLRFAYDIGSPREFYKYYWEALMGVEGMRFHWGKWMPENGETYDNVKFNLAFLKNAYPKLEEWLLLREQMDPDQVFVSDYWRSIFEIPKK